MEWSATATAGQAGGVLGGTKGCGAGRTGGPCPGSPWGDLGAVGRRGCGLPGGWLGLRHPLGPVPGGKEPRLMTGVTLPL